MRFLPMAAVSTVVTTASILAAAAPAHAAHAHHAQHRPQVTGLSLVNADTDQIIAGYAKLRKHAKFDLSKLPTANLNIVVTAPRSGSVRFTLDRRHVRLRNGAPFAFAGEHGADVLPWTPSLGKHTLKVTPYAKRNSKGRHGRSRRITFRVVRTGTSAAAARSGLSVSSLSLINTDTDQVVPGYEALTSGVALNAKTLGLTRLSIAANTLPSTVGSVAFDLDGRRVRMANSAPYALGGVSGTDYLPWMPTAGSHTLKVTPFRHPNLSGRAGAPKTISFTVSSTVASATVATTPTPSTRTSAATPATTPAANVPSTADLTLRPFAANSPWNTPVAANAAYGSASDPRTADMMQGGTTINSGAYSIPVFVATNADPLTTITSPEDTIAIHAPASAATAAGTDGNLTIIDPTHRFVDEFWIATKTGTNRWSSERHVHNDLNGSGMEGGIRAAGFSVMGGLIRQWEADAGTIDHALVIVIPGSWARRGWVAPAISQDGASSSAYAGNIPLGTRFAIPRSVNINGLGLTADGLNVARALQNYGGYVGDTTTSSNMILSAEPSMEGTARLSNMRNDLGKIRAQLRPVA
jgi:hypothetical protein